MARKTVRHVITSPERIEQINPKNKDLVESFLEYLESTDKSSGTIEAYRSDLNIAFCWCVMELENKFFVEWTKRDVQKLQMYLIKKMELNSCRIRRFKACLSSMSNYIENILDDEFPTFRNIINKIESPPKVAAREKTVLSEDEVDNLLNILMEQEQYKRACVIALAAFSGRRKAELCRFRVSDFDDDHLVCEGALYKSSPIKTKGRGSNGKMLNCYTLARNFKPYFDAWMKYREENGIESEWLFPDNTDTTKEMNTSTIDSWYAYFSEILGKDYYTHMLRHHFVTRLFKVGIPLEVIKDIVGWESVQMAILYNDTTNDESFAKYFGKEGIKSIERKDLSEI